MPLDRRGELGFEALPGQGLRRRGAHLRRHDRRRKTTLRGGTLGTQVPALWQRSAPWQRTRETGKDAYGATADGLRSSRESRAGYDQLGLRSAWLPLVSVVIFEVLRSKMKRSSAPFSPAEKTR